MAKKRTQRKTSKPAEAIVEMGDKARMELRLDRSVAQRLKDMADSTGISVNQLVQGLCRWGVDRLQPGEPIRDEHGHVTIRPQPGCLWAGRWGRYERIPDQELVERYDDDPRNLPEEWTLRPERSEYGKGEVYIFLDFTERRVVRDDLETRLAE